MVALEVTKSCEIIADCAEPKSIEEIRRMGWDIRPCQKGADSVNFGIQVVQGYELLITARSANLIKEVKKYKRHEDKN